MSILFKIMTNYLQLMTTSMAFTSSFPASLTSILTPAQRVGNSSETFLSFDCFIDDYEVKGPFSSNIYFKIFLSALLPIILTMVASVFWLVVHFTLKKWAPSLTRALIISFISIMFLLHPKLTEQSFSIFRCIDVDENVSRVRLDTRIECFSSEHVKWCLLLGFPILLVWVIAIPVIAFLLLWCNIKKDKTNKVKAYMLILYQGLKTEKFYWEFVNTIRKVCLLIVLLLSDTMKILCSVVLLVSTARLQIYLKPYKDDQNNTLELLAISAGLITMVSSLIFLQEDAVSVLDLLVLVVVVIFNAKFLIDWFYRMVQTLSPKSKFLRALLVRLDIILLKNRSGKFVVNSTNNAADAVDFDDFARDKNISRDESHNKDKELKFITRKHIKKNKLKMKKVKKQINKGSKSHRKKHGKSKEQQVSKDGDSYERFINVLPNIERDSRVLVSKKKNALKSKIKELRGGKGLKGQFPEIVDSVQDEELDYQMDWRRNLRPEDLDKKLGKEESTVLENFRVHKGNKKTKNISSDSSF